MPIKSGIATKFKAAVKGDVVADCGATPLHPAKEVTFGSVVSLVNRRSEILVLSNVQTGASIAVWPAMQGRILTSSVDGPEGLGFGWVNLELISSGEVREHINAVGGEDRLWLGPEGGQFSIFFSPGVPFDLEHWNTPAPIDTEPFEVVKKNKNFVALRKAFHLENYSGARFHVQIDRVVRLLSGQRIWRSLKINPVEGIKVVGFESDNKPTNIAKKAWSKDTGLLSLWILGQFQSNSQTTIVLPIRRGPESSLGTPVTTNYFGDIPEDRISARDDVVLFKARANYRAKLGLSIQRAKGILGSYDELKGVLTIVQYSQPTGFAEYVNASWRIQEEPYNGDVANCYTDGPTFPGESQIGDFYELESSSPAQVLGPLDFVSHVQRTIHLVGSDAQLDSISRSALGVNLEDIRSFNSK